MLIWGVDSLTRNIAVRKLDEGEVVGGKLVVTRRDPATLLNAVEEPFDPIAGAAVRRARPTAERTMDPARMFKESLTPRPELENSQGHSSSNARRSMSQVYPQR